MTHPAHMSWMAGMGLILLAGVMQGAFPLPLKFVHKWKWENLWLASSVLGLMVLPWIIAIQTIPRLLDVLNATPGRSLLVVGAFGCGWGIGGLLFGQAVHRLGVSITTGVVLGLTSAIGSVVPMAMYHPDAMLLQPGLILFGSVLLGVAGIWVCTWAGALRERNMGNAKFRHGAYWTGATICVISGILSPLFNFALICGDSLIQAATSQGARAVNAPNLVWAVAMTGGVLPTLLFCACEMTRYGTWRRFTEDTTRWDVSLAVVMGLLFAYGNSFYGMGSEYFGNLGPILGWPVFMSMQVVTGSVLGAATGEWTGAGKKARRLLITGSALLIASIFIIGQAGT